MQLTPELSELVGIHVGDGYLRYKGTRKEFDVSGSIEEKDYYDKHVVSLLNKIFGLNLTCKYFPSRRTYGLVVRNNMDLINTFKKLGFKSGNKTLTVTVPSAILKSNNLNLYAKFLRGYFDTDGCLKFKRSNSRGYSNIKRTYHHYPRIILTSVSLKLIKNISLMLNKLGLKHYITKKKSITKNWHDVYLITISGKNRLSLWMKLIKSKNMSKYTRYLIWNGYGFCPPNTTYKERVSMLKRDLNPYSFYKYGPIV